jgi:protein-disulfide isomerase
MRQGVTRAVIGGLLLGLVVAGPAVGQETQTDELKRDMESMKKMLEGVQKDVQEIKAAMLALARQGAQRSVVGVALDFASNPFKGEGTAPLTLVEFSDYQCPFCGKYVRETYPQIDAEYVKTGKLKYVFMDMPLESIHKFAFKAAEAANCAGEQGKYWQMHDRLFANQNALEPWNGHAAAVGLDVAAFEQCLTSEKFAPEIRRDMAEAGKTATTGTPAFLIGRTDPKSSKMTILAVLRGARAYPDFKAEIDRLLAEPAKPQAEAAAR